MDRRNDVATDALGGERRGDDGGQSDGLESRMDGQGDPRGAKHYGEAESRRGFPREDGREAFLLLKEANCGNVPGVHPGRQYAERELARVAIGMKGRQEDREIANRGQRAALGRNAQDWRL